MKKNKMRFKKLTESILNELNSRSEYTSYSCSNNLSEALLIHDIDRFLYNYSTINEGIIDDVKGGIKKGVDYLSDKVKEEGQKLLNQFLSYIKSAKDISVEIFNKFISLLSFIMSKLHPTEKDKISNEINNMVSKLSNVMSDSIDKEIVDKSIQDALAKAVDTKLLDKSSKEALTGSFKKNQKQIVELIKSNLDTEIEKLKANVASQLEEFDNDIKRTWGQRAIKATAGFAIGSSFMLTFGFIDNFLMFVGMGAIEDFIVSKGFDSMVAAGIGNTFSDLIGGLTGGIVASILSKKLGLKGEGTFMQKNVGVVVGCLIPVIIKMLLIIL